MHILTNHIGYLPRAPKQAILQAPLTCSLDNLTFAVIDEATRIRILEGDVNPTGPVASWKQRRFATLDFSALSTPGKYTLHVQNPKDGSLLRSHPFEIREHLLEETLSDVLYYFKGQRCADIWDAKDRSVPIFGEDRTVDVHGGWHDASGDVSKYLSHLSYANFMNPQHTPLIVWNLFRASAELNRKNETPQRYGTQRMAQRLFLEAMYGADFLVRMQDPSGAFYMTVFDQWTSDPEKRMICEYAGQDGRRFPTWQCAWRQGGGMAIAALAVAAATGQHRDYSPQRYLETAIRGFDHLEAHNLKYCNDGKENIIDDYCALMAATELYATTGEQRFMDAALCRAEGLMSRISQDENHSGWFRADDHRRTYFHGAEAGLPVIALLNLHTHIADSETQQRILDAVQRVMTFELKITGNTVNPFGYPRQYVTEPDGTRRDSFFIPQKNETGYWWQGENARLASLAAAARYTARHTESDFAVQLERYATRCVDWILGLNPYDTCMLHGRGFNNANYEEGAPNAPGGICNGITAGFADPQDIDFNPTEPLEATTGSHRWRWGEQWIPHSGWYILAIGVENH